MSNQNVEQIMSNKMSNKMSKKKLGNDEKKYLNDAMMTSIAGISAAMKNTG